MSPHFSGRRSATLRAALVPTAFVLATLGGCALFPDWHWEKPGASQTDHDTDVRFCKQVVYPGVDGFVSGETVRAMHGCMEARGWRKVPN